MYYWDGENNLELVKRKNAIVYYFKNELHRKDGPARIFYHGNNFIKSKEYWYNGKLHRSDNDPSISFYYENGANELEMYYYNGKKHRKDGPSEIWYDEFGNIIKKSYYFHGVNFKLKDLPFKMPIDSEEKEFLFKLKYGE